MFEIQQPNGCFGAYTVSSLFTIIAIDNMIKEYPIKDEVVAVYEIARKKALK